MPDARPETSAGRNAAIASVTLCLLALPIGLFAAPVLTTVSAPVSYFAAEGLTRLAWFERHPRIATTLGVIAGAIVSVVVLVVAIAVVL